MEPDDCHKFSQGLYLEVDKNNNVRITRMDFFNKAVIKEPWIVPAPKKDNSHLEVYTYEAMAKGNKPPYFSKDAVVEVKEVTARNISIEFEAADDDDLVYYYEIHLLEKDTGYPAGYHHTIVYSDFYRTPDPKQMKQRYAQKLDILSFKVIFALLEPSREYYSESFFGAEIEL